MSAVMLLTFIDISAHDFEIDGIYYTVISPANYTCCVSGISEDLDFSKEIIIPSTVSFLGKSLTVTSVGKEAFSRSKISDISLPNSCTTISSNAFYGCKSLKEITMPASITFIDYGAFMETDIKIVNISDLKAWCAIESESSPFSDSENTKLLLNGILVTTLNDEAISLIGKGAFANYQHITEAYSGSKINTIGNHAFYGCKNLTKVYLGPNISKIGSDAFNYCSNLSDLYIADSD